MSSFGARAGYVKQHVEKIHEMMAITQQLDSMGERENCWTVLLLPDFKGMCLYAFCHFEAALGFCAVFFCAVSISIYLPSKIEQL
ncbi:hypothetical protein L218DRAFT_1010370 [Marasmius fiardii PR-910]|nr:hypothetical protein L218DRAFT_1010370 [Marasmius fiardii PR-910]